MFLAFDTTQQTTLIAWLSGTGTRGACTLDTGKSTEVLLPFIAGLLAEHGEPLSALGAVTGPGSFTGIRVGLATVMGLIAANQVPAYGFSRLQLAAPLVQTGLFVLPSGREWLTQAYLDGVPQGEPRYAALAELQNRTDLVAVEALPGVPSRTIQISWAEACIDRMCNQPDPSLYPLHPCYVRPADAVVGQSLIERLLSANQPLG